ncbi:MAG: sugar ABC transporter permease [Bacilli bacterium]
MATLDNQLEYLSLSKPQRALYKFTHFFTAIPHAVAGFFRKVPKQARTTKKNTAGIFKNIFDAMKFGDFKTRLSFILMGFGLVTRHQIARGVLYFIYEIITIAFFIGYGLSSFMSLGNLGNVGVLKYTGIKDGVEIQLTLVNDNSFTIILYSVIMIFMLLALVFLWYNQLKDSLNLQRMGYVGKRMSDTQTLKNVFEKSYDKTLLFIPIGGLVIFTIIPIVMMVMIAFTDYNYNHLTPDNLIDWVGFQNFAGVFSSNSAASGGNFIKVFLEVLLWTLCWAFFATFSNYFIGMVVAMIINIKGIKFKKLWRTILITTIAVPQFISLLLVSKMFADNGFVNGLLNQLGWVKGYIGFLSDEWIAKVMIVVLNTWIGIPYTMLICTGLLMNIPDDLYESARIDGASPIKMYFKITLPYMLFVTTPYLISQFVGNINNFNVIFFLSGGNPIYGLGSGVPLSVISSGLGKTDLLITWLYKMTVSSPTKDYGTASVIGLLIFVVVAFFSLIFYNNSNSVKNEEEFQ